MPGFTGEDGFVTSRPDEWRVLVGLSTSLRQSSRVCMNVSQVSLKSTEHSSTFYNGTKHNDCHISIPTRRKEKPCKPTTYYSYNISGFQSCLFLYNYFTADPCVDTLPGSEQLEMCKGSSRCILLDQTWAIGYCNKEDKSLLISIHRWPWVLTQTLQHTANFIYASDLKAQLACWLPLVVNSAH